MCGWGHHERIGSVKDGYHVFLLFMLRKSIVISFDHVWLGVGPPLILNRSAGITKDANDGSAAWCGLNTWSCLWFSSRLFLVRLRLKAARFLLPVTCRWNLEEGYTAQSRLICPRLPGRHGLMESLETGIYCTRMCVCVCACVWRGILCIVNK